MSDSGGREPTADASGETPEGAKNARRDETGGAVGASVSLAGVTAAELRAQVPAETLRQASMTGDLAETAIIEHHFSGPLPPADVMAGYERAAPGCAKMIVDNFIREGEHRRAREMRGQYIAVFILFIVLLSATICAYFGRELTGSAIATFGLGGFFFTTRIARLSHIMGFGRRE